MLTTRFVNGAPNWIDLGTPDIDGVLSFYGGLFGWQFQSAGPDAGGYGFFQLGGRTVAGGMPSGPEQGPPAWTVYFRSEDAQATAKAAEQAHGHVLFQPTDVMGQGHMAVLADRAGVPFGIWQPARTQGVDVANEPGALCWVELCTPDIAAAAAFYHRVLGLETSAVPFPGGTYTCVNPADGGEDAMFGGIVPLADAPAEAEGGLAAVLRGHGHRRGGRHGTAARRRGAHAGDDPGGRRPHRQAQRPVRRPLRGDQKRAATGLSRAG